MLRYVESMNEFKEILIDLRRWISLQFYVNENMRSVNGMLDLELLGNVYRYIMLLFQSVDLGKIEMFCAFKF